MGDWPSAAPCASNFGEYERVSIEKVDKCKSDCKNTTPTKFGVKEGLVNVKNIEHLVKKKLPHGRSVGQNAKATKIQALAWAPNDERMAIADQMGTCFVWDTIKSIRKYGFQYPFAQSIALHPDANNPMVLIGGMKNATELYKTDPGQPKMKLVKTWVQHDGYIASVHFLAEGSKYISAAGDADLRVFDLSASPTTPALMVLRGHKKDAQSIKFARDPKYGWSNPEDVCISCSSDKTVKVWDLRIGQCTHTLTGDGVGEMNACSFFPTGGLVAAGGEKDKTYVYDLRAYRLVNKYARNQMKTASCEFSKSGRELYIGHDDGAIIVWDIFGSGENKAYAKKIEAHTTLDGGKPDITQSRVQVLDVGPTGFLASGGFDGTVKIWGAPGPA